MLHTPRSQPCQKSQSWNLVKTYSYLCLMRQGVNLAKNPRVGTWPNLHNRHTKRQGDNLDKNPELETGQTHSSCCAILHHQYPWLRLGRPGPIDRTCTKQPLHHAYAMHNICYTPILVIIIVTLIYILVDIN